MNEALDVADARRILILMKTTTPKAFKISSPQSGANLGTFTAASASAALNYMATQAGHVGFDSLCESDPTPWRGLRVVESTEWFEYAQGYRRVVGGEVATVSPGMQNRLAWSVKHLSGEVSGGSSIGIHEAKEAADGAMRG